MVDAMQPPTKTKKNKKPKASGAADPPATSGEDGSGFSDIKSLIHEHSLFFDRLVELIPAKFYLPNDAQDKPWFQGFSKAVKSEAKQKSIENAKKSRRERLDPEKASRTTLDLLKETLENEKSKGKGFGFDDSEEEEHKGRVNLEGDDRSVSYEELRRRLRRKIEELRAGRGGGVNEGKRDERREGKEGKKRKRDEEETSRKLKEEGKEKERDFEKDASEAAEGIRFGKLKLGGDEERDGKNKKKRKLSKEKELERALKVEEAAKNDPGIAKKQARKVAMERAQGKKVHDDPRKLKETIKRDKKKQKKSADKWKERMENVETKKQEKQDKRKENIKAKIDQKKMRKIERREKKLMRPGFEGRKEGFINLVKYSLEDNSACTREELIIICQCGIEEETIPSLLIPQNHFDFFPHRRWLKMENSSASNPISLDEDQVQMENNVSTTQSVTVTKSGRKSASSVWECMERLPAEGDFSIRAKCKMCDQILSRKPENINFSSKTPYSQVPQTRMA